MVKLAILQPRDRPFPSFDGFGTGADRLRPALALIEPDIAGNVGTILRLSACFGVDAHIVEPCGFAFSDRALRRAGMDYAMAANVVRHATRSQFLAQAAAQGRRLLLLTTSGETSLYEARLDPGDILMFGSESGGAPDDVHDAAALRLRIPLRAGFRSLNVAVAAGIALAELLRQTGQMPA